VCPSWKKRERRNVWFHTKLTMAPLFEGPYRHFAGFIGEFEVRETLYMLRGSYGSVLSERGGQGAEILLFFAGFFASNEDVMWVFSRPVGPFRPRSAEFEGDPLRFAA
jgi:hypothetical protein